MKTKGLINQPWEVEHEVNGSGELQPLSVRTQRTQRAICDFECSANSIEQDEEHAKLIASAPEMLAALHDISVNLRAIMDGTPNIAIGSSLDKVNRALKKASDVELKNVDYTDAPDVKLTRALT